MRHQPGAHVSGLVRAVVVDNNVYLSTRRKLLVNGVEKGYEFLLSMTAHVLSDHRAVKDVQGCKQRRRAVSLVVMGARLRGLPVFMGSGLCVRPNA